MRIAPDGDHEFHMLIVQTFHQLRRLRILGFVPLVTAPAVFAPVLPVLHDEIDGDLTLAKFRRRIEQLLLAGITLAALPEAVSPFRPERRLTRDGTVACDDVVEFWPMENG